MHQSRRPVPARWWPVVLAVAVLATSNLLTNRVLPGWAYAPWGVGLTLALLALARLDGLRLREVTGSRQSLGSGVRWGAAAMAVVLVVYLTALAVPLTRDLFDDSRVRETDGWGAIYQVGLRIPLGTVLAEEVAFRGVLLAVFVRRIGLGWGVAASSALFGLWHVLPSLGIGDTNPVGEAHLDGPIGALAATSGAVVGTAIAGAVFAWLRLRSGSLMAPALAHLGTNSIGFTLSWFYLA